MRNPGRPIPTGTGNAGATLPSLDYCELCVKPIEFGYSRCYRCHSAAGSFSSEMPDFVVPLTYAGATEQSRRDVYDYKGTPANSSAVRRLSILTYYFTQLHSGCIRRLSGAGLTSVVSVPSGRNRDPHPLDQFLRYFPQNLMKTRAVFTGAPRNGRASGISPDDFGFEASPIKDHLLILEDSWVSGSNAISLAIQAKRQGAAHVSVLSLARYLGAEPVTNEWLHTAAAKEPYDPFFCPVTRGSCPPPLPGETLTPTAG
jgi:hypothetical protein